MDSTSASSLWQQATQLAQTGQLNKALAQLEALCVQQPQHLQAWLLRAQLAIQKKDIKSAEAALNRAVEIAPDNVDALLNLANLRATLRQAEQALALFQRVEALTPKHGPLYFSRGRLFEATQQYEAAITDFSTCMKLTASHTEMQEAATLSLTRLYIATLQKEPLEILVKQALALPDSTPDCLFNIGLALFHANLKELAFDCFMRTAELQPEHAMAWFNGGVIQHQHRKKYVEAERFFKKALSIEPSNALFHACLGRNFKAMDDLDKAWEACQTALKIAPDNAHALNLASNLMTDIGDMARGIDYYNKAITQDPTNAELSGNRLFYLLHSDQTTPQEIHQAHVEHAKRHLPLSSTNVAPLKDRQKPQRIRIGYLSGEFFHHSVSYFLQGIFASHDRKQFEIFCYYFNTVNDDMTEKLKGYSDHWRDISSMGNDQVTQLIREDGIDILVELNGYTGQHRLELMAKKPAPIQVSYLGYPATTGLSAIDYRLTDALADPDNDIVNQTHTEKLMRLPHGFLCFNPPVQPAIEYQPTEDGLIRLGSFNKQTKYTPTLMKLWADILKEMPQAKLLLKSPNFGSKLANNYILRSFCALGIDAKRITLLSWSSSQEEHLKCYNQIDIALDTFPYHGTTTTCEALSMGTPVVTLVGDRHASRVGLSVLQRIGHEELIAHSTEEYICIVKTLSRQSNKIVEYKNTLRSAFQQSDLGNAPVITKDIERAYFDMLTH